MRQRDKIGELARIIDDRSYDPPRMTGSSLAISTDFDTRMNALPTPIGDEGDVLTVIDDSGDLVPSWEPPTSGTFAESDLDTVHALRSSFVSTAGGNQTVTLPTAVGIDGRRFFIKKTTGDANTVTVDTTSAQTIDGALSYVISAQWAGVMVESDNANYMIVSELI